MGPGRGPPPAPPFPLRQRPCHLFLHLPRGEVGGSGGAASADPYLLRSISEVDNHHLVAASRADAGLRLCVVRGGCPPAPSRRVHKKHQMADSPFSPVRMRMASPMGMTKTLPSPMEPVRAAAATAETTFSTIASGTTSSILTLGRKSIVYSEPRYSSV